MSSSSRFSLTIVCFLIANFVLTGCNKECDFWLEGDKCNTEVRLSYYGTYVGDYSGWPSEVYIPVIEYAGDARRLVIEDDAVGSFYVVLTSQTEFIVPYQETVSIVFGSKHWEGSGSFSENSLHYTVTRWEDGQLASFTGLK